MLNYDDFFCQSSKFVFVLMIFVMAGCALRTEEEYRPVEAVPVWNKVPDRFSSYENDRDPAIHLFFDLAPFVSVKDNEVNFVSMTPSKSEFGYELDLMSGKRYRTMRFCNHDDVWKNYNGELKAPRYTSGFVPRVLDQLGMPLEIKVFGRGDYYNGPDRLKPVSHRAKVVGGAIVHYCKHHPCQGKRGWVARMILLGADPIDTSFRNVNNLKQLRKMIDWNKFKSQIQNEKGRFVLKNREIPAVRWIASVDAKKALLFALKSGKYFKFKEMQKMRAGCHKLYDYLWETSELTRANEKDPTGGKKIEEFKDKLKLQTVIEFEEQVETKKEAKSVDFLTFFKDFHTSLLDRYSICSNYVRPSSASENIRRHHFFTYLNLFVKTQEIGFVFNCNRGGWLKNPIMQDNSFAFDPKEELWPCSKSILDKAFEAAIPIMTSQRNRGAEHYTYIGYDNVEGGTHQKINNLVFRSGKRIKCSRLSDEKLSSAEYFKKEIFPEDIRWEDFVQIRNYKDRVIR